MWNSIVCRANQRLGLWLACLRAEIVSQIHAIQMRYGDGMGATPCATEVADDVLK